MDNDFEIPVQYKNEQLFIPASLQVLGYTYRIEVDLNGTPIYFERDDNGDFRALLSPDSADKANLPDTALVQAVAASLTELLSA